MSTEQTCSVQALWPRTSGLPGLLGKLITFNTGSDWIKKEDVALKFCKVSHSRVKDRFDFKLKILKEKISSFMSNFLNPVKPTTTKK